MADKKNDVQVTNRETTKDGTTITMIVTHGK